MTPTFGSMVLALRAPALAAILMLTTADRSDVAVYSITDLGALSGGTSEGDALNNAGQIAGGSTVSSGFEHPVLRDSTITDLGTLEGGSSGLATGINDHGEVVGYAGIDQYGPQFNEIAQAFLWRNGSMQSLGALWCPCDYNRRYGRSQAQAINSMGDVVGFSETPRCASEHAFLWRDGQLIDISGGLGDPSSSRAFAINDAGQVVGLVVANHCSFPTPPARAFLWQNGARQDLGVLPGHTTSAAFGINQSGQVVGESSDGSVTRAVRWDGTTIVALGELPGQVSSSALNINSAGQIVGSSWATDRSVSRATLWQDGVAHDLNDLVGAGGGWLLLDARAINDSGAIVGAGIHGGEMRGFLLTPRTTATRRSG